MGDLQAGDACGALTSGDYGNRGRVGCGGCGWVKGWGKSVALAGPNIFGWEAFCPAPLYCHASDFRCVRAGLLLLPYGLARMEQILELSTPKEY